MQTCITGKRCYINLELAEEALVGAHIAYDYGKGGGPVNLYQCEDCGYYHFTSRGEMNERLKRMLHEGEIRRQKDANWWEERLRKK